MTSIRRIDQRISLFCGTLFVCVAANVNQAEEAPSKNITWSLRNEFRMGVKRENPNSDMGEQPVWHFLRTTRSEGPLETRRWLRDGRYAPLTEKGDRVFGLPFDGWIYRLNPAESPVVSAALEDKPGGLTVQRGDIVIAPGPEHAVVVAWESPVSGTLDIQGQFEHAQASSGVAWYVERGPSPDVGRGFEPVPLANGQLKFGTEKQAGDFTTQNLTVSAGDFVYFIVDALADGTATPHSGDGTRLGVTLSVRDAVVPPPPSFEDDVLPLLARKCHDCHGGDAKESRLDLRTVSSMLRGGESGPSVVSKKPSSSLLLERVRSGEMPPGKEKLTLDEWSLLRHWVKAGLPAKEQANPQADSLFTQAERSHWSFRPLTSLPVPNINETGSVRTPIDRFLLARLQEKQLSFAQPADRAILLRRVTFDLTGLPPTNAELAEFEQDLRADAYEQVVDRLLLSPQFGVRWGRHWLDIVGYTDTITFDEDFGAARGFLEGKWRYRDYVVNAFNRDLSYDQFILEQLAGDELVEWRNAAEYSPEVVEKLIATGFLRTPEDLSVDDPRPFVIWSNVHETVEQVGASFLGLSLHCARCHGHKFEPIPQRDYYSMMALFTPALNPSAWKNARERLLPDVAEPRQKEVQKHNAEVDRSVALVQQQIAAVRRGPELRLREDKLKAIPEPIRVDLTAALDLPADKQDAVQKYLVSKLGPLVKVEPAAIDAAFTDAERESVNQLNRQITELNGKKQSHGWIHAVYDVGPPPPTHVFKRGEFESPSLEVPPGFLRVLSNPNSEELLTTTRTNSSGRRTALARWITATDSPASALAARVMVNRTWQHLFGQGLAANSENVGMSGSAPSHPELLDWLSADFRDNGWKIKRLIRQLVLSAAYRQSSAVVDRKSAGAAAAAAAADPENLLLWRMRMRRLDAESLRDAIVAQCGRLDESLDGPPIQLVYDLATGRVSEKELEGAANYRRSVYLENRRIYNSTFLSTFDKPIVTRGVCRREQSATAPQALSLMNEPFLVANAERCADAIRSRGHTSRAEQIQAAYRLILGRGPDDEEVQWCGQHLADQSALFEKAGRSSDEASRRALASLCQTLWGTNDFLYLR
jgi:hypothetical protein